MSDPLSGHVGSANSADAAKQLDVNRKNEYQEFNCLIAYVQQGKATVILPTHNEYYFVSGTGQAKYTTVALGGDPSNTRDIPGPSSYWKHVCKIRCSIDSGAKHRLNPSVGLLAIAPELSGVDWSMFVGKDLNDLINRDEKSRIADTVRALVSNYNTEINKYPELKAPGSSPEPSSPEGAAAAYKFKTAAGANLRKELKAFKDAAGSTANIQGKVKSQYDRYKRLSPGLKQDDDGTYLRDKQNRDLSTHTKVSMTSIYSSVEFKKASWGKIKARGRKFNTLLEKTPSTIIQPLTTFVKAIGDVEDLAISSLLAVYSIITLGSGFSKPSASGKPADNTARAREENTGSR